MIVILGLTLGKEYVGKQTTLSKDNLINSPITSNVTSKEVEENFSIPQTLIIKSLSVNAVVEQVGMDSEGKMDIPSQVQNVAWYNLGYKPGAKGPAVFAGHLDTKTGDPAVFYNIANLNSGDTISVIDENGKKLTFEVERVASYEYNKFPLQEVFADASAKRLNLITCGGDWDKLSKNYSNRTVVYSVLKEQ
ncbi:MAG: class F sortase [Candidatus Levybacteria bacterium]|nr:class F sortase [Candidatus Levybacteria bacterium]